MKKKLKCLFALVASALVGSAFAESASQYGTTVTWSGAKSAYIGGDLVLTFTNTVPGACSLKLEDDYGRATKARVLVVGGGAAGVAGYNKDTHDNGWAGNGGNAGAVENQFDSDGHALSVGTYDIQVGAGGKGLTLTSKLDDLYELGAGGKGNDSAFVGGMVSLTALGGVAWDNQNKDTYFNNDDNASFSCQAHQGPFAGKSGARARRTQGNDGTDEYGAYQAWNGTGAGKLPDYEIPTTDTSYENNDQEGRHYVNHDMTGVESDITGASVEYGQGGKGAVTGSGGTTGGTDQREGRPTANGADGVTAGSGGGGSANAGTSGDGADGVVIVRLTFASMPMVEVLPVCEHASAKVYTNGVEATDKVVTNSTVDVVFTAEAGYFFNKHDYVTVWTNKGVVAEFDPTIVQEEVVTGEPAGTDVWAVRDDADESLIRLLGSGETGDFPADMKGSVSSVIVGDGVTKISDRFFKKCYKLNTITGGKDLVSVGTNAFYLCLSLEKIMIDNPDFDLNSLNGAIIYKMAIKEDGSLYMIPEVTIADCTPTLWGRKDLNDQEGWVNLGLLKDKNLEELKNEGVYHFFQVRLMKDTKDN